MLIARRFSSGVGTFVAHVGSGRRLNASSLEWSGPGLYWPAEFVLYLAVEGVGNRTGLIESWGVIWIDMDRCWSSLDVAQVLPKHPGVLVQDVLEAAGCGSVLVAVPVQFEVLEPVASQ